MAKRKRTKGQTTIFKKIEFDKPYKQPGVNSGVQER
jgi:hypothetical protein